MIQIVTLSEEQIKRELWKNYDTFSHAFEGHKRVFGFGGQLALFKKNTLALQSLLVSCSGICSPEESNNFLFWLQSAAALHGWTLLSESHSTRTYFLKDYTLTWLDIGLGTEETIIHVILTFRESKEEVWRRLFQKITKLLNSSLQNETESSSRRQASHEVLAEPIHPLTVAEFVTRLGNRYLIAYTGAGISLASGIPTFDGDGSLEHFFPLIEAFPGEVVHWMVDKPHELSAWLGHFQSSFVIAEPNDAHKALAELEKVGILRYIFTNNFDYLHWLAGNQYVYPSKIAKHIGKQTIDNNLPSDILLVIGISRDEDQIVESFRSKGYQIAIIDIHPPSYIRKDDWYVEGPAEHILPELLTYLHKTGIFVSNPLFRPLRRIENYHSKTQLNFSELINTVRMKAPNKASLLHGERHWQQVAWIGSQLAKRVPGCDPVLVLLFSILHDSKRISDGFDPDHGMRAGEFARSLNGILYKLSPLQVDLLDAACFAHSEGDISYNPTVAVCWDSDRLNLWRCGIEPDPRWLSTTQAKDLKWITWAKDLGTQVFDWSTIWSEFRPLLEQIAANE